MKTQLMLAIKSGRYDEVLTLINSVEGEDRLELINDASESTGLLPACNALEMACLGYNIRIIETLIANGAIFNGGFTSNIIHHMINDYHCVRAQVIKMKIIKIMLDNGVLIGEFQAYLGEVHSYEDVILRLRAINQFNVNPELNDQDFINYINDYEDHNYFVGFVVPPSRNSSIATSQEEIDTLSSLGDILDFQSQASI